MRRFYLKLQRLLLVLLMIPIFSYAQAQVAVTGKVISATDGNTLPGVNVVVKGTAIGTVTNLEGEFNIKVPSSESVIVISSVGYIQEEITVGEQTRFDITLDEDITGLDEVVVIGYGTAKKKELTGAVAQVKAEDLTKVASSNVAAALQGKVAGVNIQASSGSPGSASNIQIRGIATSIEGADNSPLFVVDGIPYDSDPGISPEEIETIDVLKDAASCAVYGTRGAAGVILITTKKGKAGEMRISLNSFYGIQKITSGVPLMNLSDYLYTQNIYKRNNNNSHDSENWTSLENAEYQFTNDNEIMSVIQQDNAPISNTSLQVAGGKENLTYSIVGNYFTQDGVLLNSGFEKMNARANMNFKKDKWTITSGLGFVVDEREREPWGLLYEAYKFKPYNNMVDPDALSFESNGLTNDVTNTSNLAAKFLSEDIEKGEVFNVNTKFQYNAFKGFNLTYTVGANYDNFTRVKTTPEFTIYDQDGELQTNSNRSSVYNQSGTGRKILSELGFNYNKQFGAHRLRFLGIYAYEKNTYSSFFAERYDLVSNDITVLNGTTADASVGSGEDWSQDKESVRIGLLGRVQYDFKERYYLTASVRRDASSKFSEDNQWANFPSFSGRWNLSEENFWAPLNGFVNNFSVRASWGQVGNDNFLDYQTAPTITIEQDYVFGSESSDYISYGAAQSDYANPKTAWEIAQEANIGADMGFLNNRLQLTAEYYNRIKKDMLYPLYMPGSTGAGNNATTILNIGDMTNSGFELAASYRQAGDFSWGVSGTFSMNENEVTKMNGSTKIAYYTDGQPSTVSGNTDKVTAIAEGYEAGAFFVYKTDGVVNTEAELAEFQKVMPTARMGDLIYVDVNGDGSITIDDRVYGGSGMPEWESSIAFDCSYKGFDFTMMWYASVGNEIINGSKVTAYSNGTHQDLVYQWAESNPDAVVAANRGGSHYNYRASADVWVEDGSFIRLRNVILGYTLPKSLTQRININKFRVYVAAENPLTFTKYQGYDPEIGSNGLSKRGIDQGTYPVSSQFRTGVQIDF